MWYHPFQEWTNCSKLAIEAQVWKLLNIKYKDTSTMSMASFYCFHCKLWTYFKLCPNHWLWTGKRLQGSYGKDKPFFKTRSGISCVLLYYFKCEQNLLTNSIWIYIPSQAYYESVRNFCEVFYFRRWLWLKRWGSHSKWLAVHLSFYNFFCSLED